MVEDMCVCICDMHETRAEYIECAVNKIKNENYINYVHRYVKYALTMKSFLNENDWIPDQTRQRQRLWVKEIYVVYAEIDRERVRERGRESSYRTKKLIRNFGLTHI